MPFVSGYLRIRSPGHPDQGLPPGSPGAPDQGLPGEPPYPDQGLPGMEYPDQGLPTPPPGIWPPPTISHPIVPAPPGTPPGAIWPPVSPPYVWGQRPRPGHDLPPHPDQGLPPGSPGSPDQGLPPVSPGAPTHPIATPPETFWVVCGIPGYGWKYVAISPVPGVPPRPTPEPPAPDQGLPT